MGVRVFYEGELLTNPPVTMTAVRGGDPTGWMGTTLHPTPLTTKHYSGHYSIQPPEVYRQRPKGKTGGRLALRMRDEKGQYQVAKQDPGAHGIHAFTLELPPEVESVIPELVELTPVKVVFTVKTP